MIVRDVSDKMSDLVFQFDGTHVLGCWSIRLATKAHRMLLDRRRQNVKINIVTSTLMTFLTRMVFVFEEVVFAYWEIRVSQHIIEEEIKAS